MALLSRALVALAAAGCGMGGAPGGGADGLPVSGAGPYGKLTDYDFATPLDEPVLVVDSAADLLDPAPVRDAAGAVRLFYIRRPPAGSAEIWRIDVPSLAEIPTGAQLVLSGQPGLASPAPLGDAIYFQSGPPEAPRISRLDTGDASVLAILDDAAQPTALRVDGLTYLYFTRPSQPGIFVATSSDGLRFATEPVPVLLPTGGSGFDAVAVSEPAAAGGISVAGQLRISLFFTGTDRARLTAIGYAASGDGFTFTRDPEPILEAAAPAEHGAGPLLAPTRDLLFFSQERSGRSAIAVATAP